MQLILVGLLGFRAGIEEVRVSIVILEDGVGGIQVLTIQVH